MFNAITNGTGSLQWFRVSATVIPEILRIDLDEDKNITIPIDRASP